METSTFNIYQFGRPKKLLDSVTIIIMVLVVVLLLAVGAIFSQMAFDIIDKQTQKRAIQTAQQLSALPIIQDLVTTPTDIVAQETVINILRLQTELAYAIITNRDGTIVVHPDIRLVGRQFTDPYANRALKYGSSYSQRVTENGRLLIRGAAPLLDSRYAIIGMICVAYPLDTMRKTTDSYLEKIVFFIFTFITLGLIAAIFIAKGVKWIIFGLEPSEIAYLFQERAALIEAIREGIISTNADGKITLVNEAALTTLNLSDKKEIENKHLTSIFPALDYEHILSTGETIADREFLIAGIPVIVNVAPVGERHGLVVTFRKKEDIDMIARELSQVQTFSDMLRAQTHEYSNSLHTIVGLLQIEAYNEALSFIAQETGGHRRLIRFLAENLPDKILSSMIIGKYMYASEQQIDFSIDPESRMIDIPAMFDRHTLTTALGNIISNGFEAAGKNGRVRLFMSDFGHDLIFEVEDSGPGVPENLIDRIFEKGISSKKGLQRGYGLYLARKAIESLGGTISVLREDEVTRFEIIIPKTGMNNERN